jgi:glutathione S-transferase
MHAGFATLRNTFHTNFVTHYVGEIAVSEAASKEIARALSIWDSARKATVSRLRAIGEEESDQGFLFGGFSIADAFFWPVLWVRCLFLFTYFPWSWLGRTMELMLYYASASDRITSLSTARHPRR